MNSLGRWKFGIGQMAAVTLATLTMGQALQACGQSTSGSAASGRAPVASSDAAPARAPEIVREMVDPSSGEQWLLLRDPAHRGAPGRLVLAAQKLSVNGASSHSQPPTRARELVIRVGDALIVEERSNVLDTQLEAVALASAHDGQPLEARLKIGGKVVRVVAESKGRAILTPIGGGWHE